MLTAERKKRGKKAPEGLASAETITNYRQLASHPVGLTGGRRVARVVYESVSMVKQGLHSASIPGILALDISRDSTRTITGAFCLYVHTVAC